MGVSNRSQRSRIENEEPLFIVALSIYWVWYLTLNACVNFLSASHTFMDFNWPPVMLVNACVFESVVPATHPHCSPRLVSGILSGRPFASSCHAASLSSSVNSPPGSELVMIPQRVSAWAVIDSVASSTAVTSVRFILVWFFCVVR